MIILRGCWLLAAGCGAGEPSVWLPPGDDGDDAQVARERACRDCLEWSTPDRGDSRTGYDVGGLLVRGDRAPGRWQS